MENEHAPTSWVSQFMPIVSELSNLPRFKITPVAVEACPNLRRRPSTRTSRNARASEQKSSSPIGPPHPSGQPSGRAPPTATKHAPRSGQAQPQGCDPRSDTILESSVATTQSSFFWNPSSLWCRARGCALEAGDIGQHLSRNGFGLFMHRAVWRLLLESVIMLLN